MNSLTKSLALLNGLKNNLPEGRHGEVKKEYVDEYSKIVDLLEKESLGDLSDFKIDYTLVKPQIVTLSRSGKTYTNSSFFPRALLLSKIDSLLLCFEIDHKEKDDSVSIGFDFKSEK